jgi:hypothetical protein
VCSVDGHFYLCDEKLMVLPNMYKEAAVKTNSGSLLCVLRLHFGFQEDQGQGVMAVRSLASAPVPQEKAD